MKSPPFTAVLAALVASATCQNISFLTDSGVYGPPLEVAHAYYDEWPTG